MDEALRSRVVITYGTFDLFHIGHLNILKRAKMLGDYLIVGVSTDEFNETKNKKSIMPYKYRSEIVRNISCVDKVIPENSWDQKKDDILRENVSVFTMGSDWVGKFDFISAYCEIIYLERTPDVSSTEIKRLLRTINASHINEIKNALDLMNSIINQYR